MDILDYCTTSTFLLLTVITTSKRTLYIWKGKVQLQNTTSTNLCGDTEVKIIKCKGNFASCVYIEINGKKERSI